MKKLFKIPKKVISISFSAAPFLVSLNSVFLIFSGLVSVFFIRVTADFFDAVNVSVQNATWHTIIGIFSLFVSLHFIREFISWMIDVLDFRAERKINDHVNYLFHKKTSKIPRINFDNSEFVECLELAMQGIYSVDYYLFNILGFVVKDIPYFTFLGIYLYSLRPILLLAPLFIFIPIIISQVLNAKENKKLREETIYLNRKLDHYRNILTGAEYVKETRLLGTFSHFINLHKDLLNVLNKKLWKSDIYKQLLSTLSKLLNLIGYYGVLFLLFDSLMSKFITIGQFAAVFTYIQIMYSTIENIIVNRIGNMINYDYTDLKYLVDYLDSDEEVTGKKEYKFSSEIVLENVSFMYPGREKKALDNINLKINKGETIAIVGVNGSGKTTLSKLILGLYTPSEGIINYDNNKKREYNEKSFYKNKSAIFQNYCRYFFSLKDNISISDLYTFPDEYRLIKACNESELMYDNKNMFPAGYDTKLSKQFGGVDLSGGEWQRVAFARSFYRQYDFIILDEPTAAIDPIEEANIYNKFSQIVNQRTAVIITHRLGAVKLADRIIVMEDGKIIEEGTHNMLINKNGLYKKLYSLQSQWYV